jgi:hypothetical protein
MIKRWVDFAYFRDDGRICLTNNASAKALPPHRSRKAQLDLRRFSARGRPRRYHADASHYRMP